MCQSTYACVDIRLALKNFFSLMSFFFDSLALNILSDNENPRQNRLKINVV